MLKGHKLTPEQRARCSEAQKGKTLSPEHRANIASARMGHVVTPKTREKLRVANLGNTASETTRATMRAARQGSENPCWRGGETLSKGYVQVLSPGHPAVTSNGYVRRNRLVMETHIGRFLLPTEIVHHRDGNKENDAIENLQLFDSNSAHVRHHAALRAAGGRQ